MLETIGNSAANFKPRIQRLITQYTLLKFGVFYIKYQIGVNFLAK